MTHSNTLTPTITNPSEATSVSPLEQSGSSKMKGFKSGALLEGNNVNFEAKVKLINELIKNHKSAQFLRSKNERKEHLRNSLIKVAAIVDVSEALKQKKAEAMLDQTYYVVADFYLANQDKLIPVSNVAMIKKLEIAL